MSSMTPALIMRSPSSPPNLSPHPYTVVPGLCKFNAHHKYVSLPQSGQKLLVIVLPLSAIFVTALGVPVGHQVYILTLVPLDYH